MSLSQKIQTIMNGHDIKISIHIKLSAVKVILRGKYITLILLLLKKNTKVKELDMRLRKLEKGAVKLTKRHWEGM